MTGRREIGRFICGALFATLTNVNFDPAHFSSLLSECTKHRDNLLAKIKAPGRNVSLTHDSVHFKPAGSVEELVSPSEKLGLKTYPATSEDVLSLKHIALFGLRGGLPPMQTMPRFSAPRTSVFMHSWRKASRSLYNENLTLDEGVALVSSAEI